MGDEPEKRFLIVVLDALRPEFVTPELMPNLHGFAHGGVRFNRFPLPEAAPGSVLDSGKDEAFEAALKQLPGDLLGVPAMGGILAANSKRFATISAGTSGGGRLINITAERTGSFRLALRRTEAAVPAGAFETVAAQVGPLPEYGVPGLAWNSYAIDCYLDYVEPELKPDVMLLWLSEPDESFHWHGIGSPQAVGAIRHMDAEFGRILARQDAAIETGALQVIAMSDHGQISLAGEKLNLATRFNEAGFNASGSPADDPDYVVVVHNGGGIWVRGQPVFTRDGVEGTLRHGQVGVDHPRAADIVLALSHDDGDNDWGRAGRSASNAPYPGGCHGGLSRYELNNFIAMAGSAFRPGAVVETPAGNIDVLPTVLSVLGVPIDHRIDGRVLTEAMSGREADPQAEAREIVMCSANTTQRQTLLSVTEYDGARYLNRAWAE
jgi:hypothetical protein